MFDFLIVLVIATNIYFYGLGIKMAKTLENKNVSSFKKYGAPKFYVYGVSEYRFLFLYILYGDYKRDDLDESILKIINNYRYTFFFNILLFLIFLVFFIYMNKGS